MGGQSDPPPEISSPDPFDPSLGVTPSPRPHCPAQERERHRAVPDA